MKKLENFSNCLNVLKNADFDLADNNDIYRTGVIGQLILQLNLHGKLYRKSKKTRRNKGRLEKIKKQEC